MPRAIIGGLPTELARRVDAHLRKNGPRIVGWDLTWVRSRTRTPGITPGQIDEVANLAAESGDGAHLLIYDRADTRERRSIQESLGPYFRFRWLDLRPLAQIPALLDQYFAGLSGILKEEKLWYDLVKPTDELSPLLLPECSFTAAKQIEDLWERARAWGSQARIRGAAETVETFHSIHRVAIQGRGRRWVDSQSRIFDHTGPRHGQHAPFPRHWKWSYQVPKGFHYDVVEEKSRRFSITDQAQISHNIEANRHINIDCHGFIRW